MHVEHQVDVGTHRRADRLDDLGFGLAKELLFVEEATALGFAVAAFAANSASAAMMVDKGAAALVTPDPSAIDVAGLSSEVPVVALDSSQEESRPERSTGGY